MYATIHDEMMKSLEHLDDSTKGKVLLAYVNYQLYGIEPSQDDVLVYSIFMCKKFDLDCMRNRSEIARENWLKWGRPRKDFTVENLAKTKKTQAKANETETKAKETQKNQEKEKEKENKKEIIKENKLDDVLVEFKKMRKEIKKPITERWLELVRMKLDKMYPWREDLQIMAVNKSIENSWQWIFELSNNDIALYKRKNEEKKEVVEVKKEIELSEEEKKQIRERYAELRKNVLKGS